MRALGEVLAFACCCFVVAVARVEAGVVIGYSDGLLILVGGGLLWHVMHLVAFLERQ